MQSPQSALSCPKAIDSDLSDERLEKNCWPSLNEGKPNPSCHRLLWLEIDLAAILARPGEGTSIPAKGAMVAIAINNSERVKPLRFVWLLSISDPVLLRLSRTIKCSLRNSAVHF